MSYRPFNTNLFYFIGKRKTVAICWTCVISGISLIQYFSLSAHFIFKAAFPSKFYHVYLKPDSGGWDNQTVTQLVAAYYLKQALKVPSN